LRALLRGPLPRGVRALAVLGRFSLSFYMLHQPVLIGLIVAALWLGRGAAA
jgi:peptidoglycan/LPS O-acetylase OafA/YrhL